MSSAIPPKGYSADWEEGAGDNPGAGGRAACLFAAADESKPWTRRGRYSGLRVKRCYRRPVICVLTWHAHTK